MNWAFWCLMGPDIFTETCNQETAEFMSVVVCIFWLEFL